MVKKVVKKITTVRKHPMRVPVSKKNPAGITIRDKHQRRLKGTYLNRKDIGALYKSYDRKNVIYPANGKLSIKNSDKYDDLIAVWTDYFNKKFNVDPPLDPDIIKALIASESDFREDPPGNPKATGITQITPDTHREIQDPKGEVKEFIFNDIRKKDLKNPNIAIPVGVRWIFRKKRLAEGKLGRAASAEEIILEYKGLLKSKTTYKDRALEKFRENYAKLKKK
jgi:hypothetical protein